MKIGVWLGKRENARWITAFEILGLGLLMVGPAGPLVRLLFGLPLLVHVGYQALTTPPSASLPGHPQKEQPRRHYDLRARVVRFLDEVKQVEDYAQRAEVAGWPERDVEEYLFKAQRRVMAAAREVARQTGRHVVRA